MTEERKTTVYIYLFPHYIGLGPALYSKKKRFASLIKEHNVELEKKHWDGSLSSIPTGCPSIIRRSTQDYCRDAELAKLCSERGHFVYYDDYLVCMDGELRTEGLDEAFTAFLERFHNYLKKHPQERPKRKLKPKPKPREQPKIKPQVKLRIQQISGNSRLVMGFDDIADTFFELAGFVRRGTNKPEMGMCSGSVPAPGKEFFVYYLEPEQKGYDGGFVLVRIDGEKEVVIDKGSACKSHFHGGLKTTTFYGKGRILRSWSFHCKPLD